MHVRIPSSAPRRTALKYAKLLRRVRSVSRCGLDWEGTFIHPGALVEETDLRPSPDWPEHPCLLECAGISKAGRGHNRSELLYSLWQYDHDRHDWMELGRASSQTWTWAADLAPLAKRAMGERAVDLGDIVYRIHIFLAAEMDRVPEGQRGMVAAIAHDALAAEWELSGDTPAPIPPLVIPPGVQLAAAKPARAHAA